MAFICLQSTVDKREGEDAPARIQPHQEAREGWGSVHTAWGKAPEDSVSPLRVGLIAGQPQTHLCPLSISWP